MPEPIIFIIIYHIISYHKLKKINFIINIMRHRQSDRGAGISELVNMLHCCNKNSFGIL